MIVSGALTALSCKKCGAPLTEAPDGAVLRCSYCGQTHWLEQARRESTRPKKAPTAVAPVVIAVLVGGLALAAVGMLFAARATAPAPSTASAGNDGPGDPTLVYAAGQAVDVYWGSSWWPGTIKNVNGGGTYRIGYDGWSTSWDEDVTARRLRPRISAALPQATAGPSPGDPTATYRAGEVVDIHWGQRWWPGKVLGVEGSRYRVTYDGWSSSHDETVDATRLRRR